MKANPYVYPFIEFKDLSKKKIRWVLTPPKNINLIELKNYLSKIKFPLAKIKGKTVNVKIFNIFLDNNFLYGPKDNIVIDQKTWLEKIDYFTKQNKPLTLTVHGFPFKIPCLLKTNRIDPDLGEITALLKINSLIVSINRVYSPGAKIVIIGEGGFAKFVGIDKKNWVNYRNIIRKFIDLLQLNNISIIDIADLEKEKDFKKTFNKIKKDLANLYKKKDESVVKKINGTLDSVYRIISTKKYDEELLMDIYNNKLDNPKIDKIRKILMRKTITTVFDYHAFLMTRDKLDFVNKKAPHSLPLTVSPKRGRLGVFPISPDNNKLPYHGVPVLNRSNRIKIEYLIDLKRSTKKFTPIYLSNDRDKAPFFYKSN